MYAVLYLFPLFHWYVLIAMIPCSCPTECRLSYSDNKWECTVYLRFFTDSIGQPLSHPRNELFGETIYNKYDVEDRIRRAQRAILNPSIHPDRFLEAETEITDSELTFSTNCVSLVISGKDMADLSFCDLPGSLLVKIRRILLIFDATGLIASGRDADITMIKNLLESYISKPSCIILSTVACESKLTSSPNQDRLFIVIITADYENQGAHHLAKLHDPEGIRTIGIFNQYFRCTHDPISYLYHRCSHQT